MPKLKKKIDTITPSEEVENANGTHAITVMEIIDIIMNA